MSPHPTSSSSVPPHPRWRLAPGVEVHARHWDGETAVYFGGAGETMVLTELGAAVIDGVIAGCPDLSALYRWCRDHGRAESDDVLLDSLLDLLEKLAEFEIIEPAS